MSAAFHYLVSQALQFTCGLDESQSLAFATVLHFSCSILAICVNRCRLLDLAADSYEEACPLAHKTLALIWIVHP